MKNLFILLILTLTFPAVIFSQSGGSGESEDTRVEKELALFAEQFPGVNTEPQITALINGVTHPLFIGVDDITVPAYIGNVSTNEWLQAFVGAQVWGAAYNNLSDKIYFNNGSTLYEWNVGGGSFTQLGTITDTLGATQSMVSLAFYDGKLYATKNIANEAVYEIDTTTLVARPIIDYVDGDFDLGGLAINPNTGEFYATNDDTTPFGSGLFKINMNGTGTFITSYPAGQTDIDGLAISDNNIAYLIIDEPGSIFVYDLVANTYLPPLTNPWTSSEIFSGGTWNTGIIPVELTSFTADINGNIVTLNWETATETNNSGFSIERKSSVSEYQTIGFVPGFGTTTESKSYSYSDDNVQPGNYIYRLRQIDYNGTYEYSPAVEVEVYAPSEFTLNQNYPNPFNPSTKINFSLAADSKVTLTIFNLIGEKVAELINGNLSAGTHEVIFDAANLQSGVYFYKLHAVGNDGSDFTSVKKMILTK